MFAGLSHDEASLFAACQRDDDKEVLRLVEAGVNPSARNALGQSALAVAGLQNASLVRVFTQFFSPLEKSLLGDTVLHVAAERASPEVLAALLEAVPRDEGVNVVDQSHQTPLFSAALHGSAQACRLLLEREADPDMAASGSGLTPFLAAAKAGHAAVVEVLADKADGGAHDAKGRNALHLAVIGQHVDVVKLLICRELAVEEDQMGKTPFDYAAKHSTIKRLFDELVREENAVEQAIQEESRDEKREDRLDPEQEPPDDIEERDSAESQAPVASKLTKQQQQAAGRMVFKLFEDEVMDFTGQSGGDLDGQVNDFLAAVPGQVELVSQSLSCVSIPSLDKSKPGRIKRTLSLCIKYA